MSRSYAQVCPIALTLDIVGDRWSLLIIRDLFFGRNKFKELLAHSHGMPTKILSDRLKSLEASRLIERRIYSIHPLRAEYLLTEKGRSLAPVMEAIVTWGMEHTVDAAERPDLIARIRSDVAAVPGGPNAMGWQANWIREPIKPVRSPNASRRNDRSRPGRSSPERPKRVSTRRTKSG